MEAINQLSESEDKNIIDPIKVAVNSAALLTPRQRVYIDSMESKIAYQQRK